MSDVPVIETERLRLRAPSLGDLSLYTEHFSVAEASHFNGGPMTALDIWQRLAADIGHWSLRGYGFWVCEDKELGEAVGGCGLIWPDGWPRSELTWWIAPRFRRRGYALEASRAAVAFGYDTLKWDLVETHMRDENVAARSLVEKLGGSVMARETFPDGKTRDIFHIPRP